MSATDELRRLLDERGVEWGTQIGIESHYKTMWRSGSWEYTAIETSGGEFSVYVEHRGWLTPEQAIAATLGNDEPERSNDGVSELEAENAKLREVAGKTWRLAERLCHAIEGPCQSDGSCPLGERDEECVYGLIQFELRELGVEVDE